MINILAHNGNLNLSFGAKKIELRPCIFFDCNPSISIVDPRDEEKKSKLFFDNTPSLTKACFIFVRPNTFFAGKKIITMKNFHPE